MNIYKSNRSCDECAKGIKIFLLFYFDQDNPLK